MPPLKFRSPEGKVITIDSPDGSVPTEQELDALFSIAKNTNTPQPIPAAEQPGLISTLVNANPEELAKRGHWVQGGLLKTADDIYREGISPIVSGASTLALGIPKAVAKETGTKDIIYPEQKTLPGKALRLGSEVVGLVGGGAAKAAEWTAGKALSKILGNTLTKKVAKGAITGGVMGALQTPEEGAGILKPEERLKQARNWGVIGGVLPAIVPGLKGVSKVANKMGARITGVENDVLKEVEEKGFRNVISKKYLDKKLPEVIQSRIEQNINDLESAAGQKYQDLTTPLRKAKFDLPEFRGEVVKRANKVKNNPFVTEKSNIDNAILDGIVNKAKVANLGDALDLRRSLDDIIYSGTGELKTSFGKEVRDLLNRTLHKNAALKQVDADWVSLQGALKGARKVVGETGEKYLARFNELTHKQKQMLGELQRMIGGTPFMDDLTNYGLAKKFATPLRPLSSASSLIQSVTKPVYRGVIRQGEKITQGAEKAGLKTEELLKLLRNAIKGKDGNI